ncbi:LytR family transcriptional regulator [Amycolatopsis alkalitolerans]|uniref:LytR family transcriptional regulator n=1 Tax=Amycolatopsis alkalitolerans TaxID=2547244 RepID=A0A5C4M1V4_9PSEU|nr:LytR family transcriptional regulator [Amycolatopsis alkalitolerans]
MLAVCGAALGLDLSLTRVPAFTDYGGRLTGTGGTNWLLVGSDSREGLSAQQEQRLDTGDTATASGARTDSIMLLHMPSGRGPATLVSLPRDSLVPIHGYGENKLNAAYSFGGPTLLSRTVEETTGLHVDHYLEIGFGGFAGVVDTVGGVRVCLPEALHDPKIDLDLAPGCQSLDGAHALKYMRTRAFARGDLERVEHQRQFLAALAAKCTSRRVLLDPLQSVPMVLRLSGGLTVSDHDHLDDLLRLGAALTSGLVTTTVPVGGSRNLPGVGAALLWNQEQAAQLFAGLRTGG